MKQFFNKTLLLITLNAIYVHNDLIGNSFKHQSPSMFPYILSTNQRVVESFHMEKIKYDPIMQKVY